MDSLPSIPVLSGNVSLGMYIAATGERTHKPTCPICMYVVKPSFAVWFLTIWTQKSDSLKGLCITVWVHRHCAINAYGKQGVLNAIAMTRRTRGIAAEKCA